MRTAGSILVIEDNLHLQEVISELLRHWGYHVVALSSLVELTQLGDRELGLFDACLSDFYLEDGTGLEVVRAFKRSNPETPIILLTGSLSAEALSLQVGVPALPKPFELGELRELLNQSLGRNQEHQERTA